MKFFHQLLVAPAALGLIAPIAANASDLNIHGVSDYANTGERSMARTLKVKAQSLTPRHW